MEEFFNIGISESTINEMIERNPEIKEITSEEINNKKYILEKIGCSNNQIINIIGSNPEYLNRTNDEIISLLKCLVDYGFKTLNILFDSNPYILNLDKFEIDKYINKRISNNESLDDIIDDLDSNPILFNEM